MSKKGRHTDMEDSPATRSHRSGLIILDTSGGELRAPQPLHDTSMDCEKQVKLSLLSQAGLPSSQENQESLAHSFNPGVLPFTATRGCVPRSQAFMIKETKSPRITAQRSLLVISLRYSILPNPGYSDWPLPPKILCRHPFLLVNCSAHYHVSRVLRRRLSSRYCSPYLLAAAIQPEPLLGAPLGLDDFYRQIVPILRHRQAHQQCYSKTSTCGTERRGNITATSPTIELWDQPVFWTSAVHLPHTCCRHIPACMPPNTPNRHHRPSLQLCRDHLPVPTGTHCYCLHRSKYFSGRGVLSPPAATQDLVRSPVPNTSTAQHPFPCPRPSDRLVSAPCYSTLLCSTPVSLPSVVFFIIVIVNPPLISFTLSLYLLLFHLAPSPLPTRPNRHQFDHIAGPFTESFCCSRYQSRSHPSVSKRNVPPETLSRPCAGLHCA